MRIGYLECFSGISGDMMLGALVDAGVPFAVLVEAADALNVGARLEMRKVSRGGIAATKVDVITKEQESGVRHQESGHDAHHREHETHSHKHTHGDGGHEHTHDHEHHEHAHGEHEHGADETVAHSHEHTHGDGGHEHTHDHDHDHDHDHEHSHEPTADQHGHESESGHEHAAHRSLSTILAIIGAAPLSGRVKQQATRAFQMLGEVEAAIHSIPVERVHFHEVGAVDTIIDIVCTAAGCEALGVTRWQSTPLNVGSGTVKCQHGTLPVPAPATLALLGDAPVYSAGPAMERVTPTGAAVLRMLDVTYGSLPAMRVEARGYGAGGRDTLGEPNLLRLLVGEANDESATAEPIAVIETVIDDSTPQLLAYVSELLLEAGAWDVYRSAVQMKKGRTGVQLTVLSSPDKSPALRELLLRETTTIGLRWRLENKLALEREFAEVETPWGKVGIKIARWPSGDVANASVEYEHCRAIARQHSIPLKQVMQEAMRKYAELEQSKEGKSR